MGAVVTGGAGFIGSNLVEALSKRRGSGPVTVVDNFSTGSMENLSGLKDRIKIVKGDLSNPRFALQSLKGSGADTVFHLAANYSVKRSSDEPLFDLQSNLVTTLNVLEAMRRSDIPRIVFTSSSTVYGSTDKFPIPETAMLSPISNYGASKLAAESYIRTFSELYGIKGLVLRYANIIGPGCSHGVVRDFVDKLSENPRKLTILGNGKQKKSYLSVDDCVDATLFLAGKAGRYDVFNVGSEDWITVDEIAGIVCDSMGLAGTKFVHTGGETGWPGDVSRFLLDVRKARRLGWKSKHSTEDSIRSTVVWLTRKQRGRQ